MKRLVIFALLAIAQVNGAIAAEDIVARGLAIKAARPTTDAYTSGRTRAALGPFMTALAGSLASGTNTIITLFGDSKTLSSGGLVQANSKAARLAAELNARGYIATDTLVGAFSTTIATLQAWEPRYSAGAGAFGNWNQVGAPKSLSLQSANATITFSPGYAHDVIDFHWPAYPTAAQGGGSMTVALTDNGTFNWATYLASGGAAVASGGPVTSAVINQNGASGTMYHTVITRAATSAANAGIVYTNGATNGTQIGFTECWKTGQGRVFVRSNGAVAYTSTLLNNATIFTYFLQERSHLVIADVGTNDWATGVSPATTTSNMQAILPNIMALSPTILLETPTPADYSSYPRANQLATVNAIRPLAGNVSYGSPILLDRWQRGDDRGGYAAAYGLYYDNIHESSAGIMDMTKTEVKALFWEN